MNTQPHLSNISSIQQLPTKGPWHSKSGGELTVLFGLDATLLATFLDYDNPEFSAIAQRTGTDIHGLRTYNVSNIPSGSTGANEFHLARTELVTALSGRALWKCEDVYGNTTEYTLDSTTSLMVPPGILHTYTALEDNTRLQVVCNTLFNPDDPGTHDSFSSEDFRKLQAEHQSKASS